MKAQAKSLETVHESLVQVTYSCNACTFVYYRVPKNKKETRVADGNFMAGR